ncbi:MAG: S10 family peptidase [Chloroflexota bacterium]
MSETTEPQKEPTVPPEPKDELVVTQHTALIDGQEIAYTVTCGTLVLKEETEGKGEKEGQAEGAKPKATVFFTAYTRDGVDDLSHRPLTFSFNGGPGSSSVWLHLGTLGPRRVVMGDAGALLPPPWQLENNPFSILDLTDLVFIDPVSTGYSRAVTGEKAREFHGFKKDIESVGDFIRLYTTRTQRWGSPKFLIGESYGTTRASGLAGYLQERHGLFLNGLMLISAVLNFGTLEFDANNDLPYILFLPTYTATAWYHRRLPPELQQLPLRQVLDQVEAFVYNEYLVSMMKGAALGAEARAALARRLAHFTGLSEDFLQRADLRIKDMRFFKELLRAEHRTVGRLDSRFTGFDRDAAGETFEHDPSMSAIMGPYTAAFYQYVRGSLKFETDLPYEVLNPKVWPWNYSEHENKYVDVGETLRQAIMQNPFLKVFVANGYYDLATPYFATEYTFNRLGLDPQVRPNISMAYYEAGHMMYVHQPSLEKLKADLGEFIRRSAP